MGHLTLRYWPRPEVSSVREGSTPITPVFYVKRLIMAKPYSVRTEKDKPPLLQIATHTTVLTTRGSVNYVLRDTGANPSVIRPSGSRANVLGDDWVLCKPSSHAFIEPSRGETHAVLGPVIANRRKSAVMIHDSR